MHRELPDYIVRALRTGVRTWDGGGYSRDHLVFSIGLSMYQHGWSETEFIDEIVNPENIVGEKVQNMPPVKARKRLVRDWDRIIDFVDANPPQKGRAVVEKRLRNDLETVAAAPWGGRTGNTDRHVLLTILAMAHGVGTYTPAFSTRTLATVANKNQETVRRSMRRLRDQGFLALITPNTYTKSAVYEVSTRTLYIESLNSNPGGGLSDTIKSVHGVLGHDLFTRGCLGEAAGRLWTQLRRSQEYTVAEMSKQLGLSPNSCRNSAKRLVNAGLADIKSGRPARYTMVDPTQEADPEGLDLLLMEMETWAIPYGDDGEFLDYSDQLGKGDKRSALYTRQQDARKVQFSKFFDRPTGEFVDPVTGEIMERT